MLKHTLNAIEQYGMLDGTRNVTVALSGGADSMSLLYIMLELKENFGLNISAAHLNHCIRGAESDRDEQFVRDICDKLSIKLFCERADVISYAKERQLSTELAAREIRYDFLKRVNTGVVATAHTASDNLETMLFNLTRGAALKGLCGIPAKRDIFIRPLILCTRDMVEQYCTDNDIAYVTDSTNLTDDYTRNKIRHNIIPLLKSINPSVETAAARTSVSLSEDNEFLDKTAEKLLSDNILDDGALSLEKFNDFFPSVIKRAIKKFFRLNSGLNSIEAKHINEIYRICLEGGKISLPGNTFAVAADNKLKIIKKSEKIPLKNDFKVDIIEAVNDLFTKNEKVNNLLLKNSLDCDKIVGKLVVRTRVTGDSIRIKNSNGTKTLKKLYNEFKIPLDEREYLPVISDDVGVVWISGIGVASRCAVSGNTSRIFKISISKK